MARSDVHPGTFAIWMADVYPDALKTTDAQVRTRRVILLALQLSESSHALPDGEVTAMALLLQYTPIRAAAHLSTHHHLLQPPLFALQEAAVLLNDVPVVQVVQTVPAIDFDITAAAASADGHQLLLVGATRQVRSCCLLQYNKAGSSTGSSTAAPEPR